MDTVSLVEEVGFDALFTFIYSPRPGTKAAAHAGPRHPGGESRTGSTGCWRCRTRISAELHAAYVGKTVRVPGGRRE